LTFQPTAELLFCYILVFHHHITHIHSHSHCTPPPTIQHVFYSCCFFYRSRELRCLALRYVGAAEQRAASSQQEPGRRTPSHPQIGTIHRFTPPVRQTPSSFSIPRQVIANHSLARSASVCISSSTTQISTIQPHITSRARLHEEAISIIGLPNIWCQSFVSAGRTDTLTARWLVV
jgi:hypothetical protein